ncbi:hypothetical protein EV426DRAFT_357246 [Tirmania nivea]|nr:hypothetical protein EV426DRAFT_357246 [Tirmania nivea]
MPKPEPYSSKPRFPCFEPRCQRHSNPYRTFSGLQKHLESVLSSIVRKSLSNKGSTGKWHTSGFRKMLEDEEDEEDEEVEIISQLLLRVPEASSTSFLPNSGATSGQHTTHKRRTPNPTASHEHRHTHYPTNEIFNPSGGVQQDYPGYRKKNHYSYTFGNDRVTGDSRKAPDEGRREAGKVAETRSRSMRSKRTLVEAEAEDGQVSQRGTSKVAAGSHPPIQNNPAASSLSYNPVDGSPRIPSY